MSAETRKSNFVDEYYARHVDDVDYGGRTIRRRERLLVGGKHSDA